MAPFYILDGGPDLRYKNNAKDSLVELGLIEIKIGIVI